MGEIQSHYHCAPLKPTIPFSRKAGCSAIAINEISNHDTYFGIKLIQNEAGVYILLYPPPW